MWYGRAWSWAKEHLTITVPGVVVIFVATWVLMLAVNSGEVGAAWVQAIGSLGAIYAVLVVWFDQRRVAHAQLSDQKSILDAAILADVGSVITHLDTLIGEKHGLGVLSHIEGVDWYQTQSLYAQVLADIEKIDAAKMSSIEIVISLGALKRNLRSAGIFIGMIVLNPTHRTLIDILRGELGEALKAARLLEDLLQKK